MRAAELAGLGMVLPEKASLLDVVGAFDEAVDRRLRKAGHRTDLTEMARFAAVEALSHLGAQETGSLFGVSTEQTQQTLRRYATPHRFDSVGKDFFGRFLYRFLDYHLSRELPNHVGRADNSQTCVSTQGSKTRLSGIAEKPSSS